MEHKVQTAEAKSMQPNPTVGSPLTPERINQLALAFVSKPKVAEQLGEAEREAITEGGLGTITTFEGINTLNGRAIKPIMPDSGGEARAKLLEAELQSEAAKEKIAIFERGMCALFAQPGFTLTQADLDFFNQYGSFRELSRKILWEATDADGNRTRIRVAEDFTFADINDKQYGSRTVEGQITSTGILPEGVKIRAIPFEGSRWGTTIYEADVTNGELRGIKSGFVEYASETEGDKGQMTKTEAENWDTIFYDYEVVRNNVKDTGVQPLLDLIAETQNPDLLEFILQKVEDERLVASIARKSELSAEKIGDLYLKYKDDRVVLSALIQNPAFAVYKPEEYAQFKNSEDMVLRFSYYININCEDEIDLNCMASVFDSFSPEYNELYGNFRNAQMMIHLFNDYLQSRKSVSAEFLGLMIEALKNPSDKYSRRAGLRRLVDSKVWFKISEEDITSIVDKCAECNIDLHTAFMGWFLRSADLSKDELELIKDQEKLSNITSNIEAILHSDISSSFDDDIIMHYEGTPEEVIERILTSRRRLASDTNFEAYVGLLKKREMSADLKGKVEDKVFEIMQDTPDRSVGTGFIASNVFNIDDFLSTRYYQDPDVFKYKVIELVANPNLPASLRMGLMKLVEDGVIEPAIRTSEYIPFSIYQELRTKTISSPASHSIIAFNITVKSDGYLSEAEKEELKIPV